MSAMPVSMKEPPCICFGAQSLVVKPGSGSRIEAGQTSVERGNGLLSKAQRDFRLERQRLGEQGLVQDIVVPVGDVDSDR
ncbi:MAG TPA: hypothetical protein VFA70_03830, partial [Dehalococcoidia bacterium]|nr:hypothetical protein [Dehalococcoidia bacterium]